ncbi:MAG: hypothetical protein ABEK12_00170, partial [Candidatus Nanohaloarchaea archaeon]
MGDDVVAAWLDAVWADRTDADRRSAADGRGSDTFAERWRSLVPADPDDDPDPVETSYGEDDRSDRPTELAVVEADLGHGLFGFTH